MTSPKSNARAEHEVYDIRLAVTESGGRTFYKATIAYGSRTVAFVDWQPNLHEVLADCADSIEWLRAGARQEVAE
jgi:hypothetical protein